MDDTLRAIWNWLPAFRAVAETEHLPTAAQRLHVTPPAISRSVKLLEEALGVELFNRTGGRLVLNGAGQEFLDALQGSMSELGRALGKATEDPLSGSVRVASLGVLTDHFVLPALLALTEAHPLLTPQILTHRPLQANEALRRGQIDVAFYYEPLTDEALEVHSVGQTTASVYCGVGHELYEKEDLTLSDLQEHPFSVPQVGDSGQVMDGWPVDLERQVGMRITQLTTNLEVCRSGRFVTVLPDVVAHKGVVAGELRRLPFDLLEPIPLFGAVRRRDPPASSGRVVLDRVRLRVEQVARDLCP
jgi:DNA-binding transcriptional LysR family regulator